MHTGDRSFGLGAVVVVIVWWLDLQLLMQSKPITINAASSNPIQARCTQYNIMWTSLSVTCGRSVVFSINLTSNYGRWQKWKYPIKPSKIVWKIEMFCFYDIDLVCILSSIVNQQGGKIHHADILHFCNSSFCLQLLYFSA
jgi:hypothetical protein